MSLMIPMSMSLSAPGSSCTSLALVCLELDQQSALKTLPAARNFHAAGLSFGLARLLVDVGAAGFLDEQQSDHQRHCRDDDRVPQAGVDVAGCRNDREGEGGEQTAEPAIADVIGQRHGGIADARREHL